MECRLDQAPLPAPQFSFAHEKTLAQNWPEYGFEFSVTCAATIIAMVILEDVFDGIRMVDKIDVLRSDLEMDQFAVFSIDIDEKMEWVSPDTEQHPNEGKSEGAWGIVTIIDPGQFFLPEWIG